LAAIMSDPELYRFIPQSPPTLSELEARYRRTAAGPHRAGERWWNWAVFTSQDEGAGTVELSLDLGNASASLAYLFARAYWGAGYASEACAAAIAHAGTAADIERVTATIDTRNERSIALVERLGFTRVATIENADVFGGAPSDEFVYERALRA
jgi:RimJ/RimL family protein N-acetyltransferase